MDRCFTVITTTEKSEGELIRALFFVYVCVCSWLKYPDFIPELKCLYMCVHTIPFFHNVFPISGDIVGGFTEKQAVLVRAAMTKTWWTRRLKQQMCIFSVLEVGSPRSTCLQATDVFWWGPTSWFADGCLLATYIFTWWRAERGNDLPRVFSCKH